MGGRSRVMYRKRHTHDHRRVCRIGQPGNISGFRYNVDPTELHIDSNIDVLESVVYNIISMSRCLLHCNIRVVLWPCFEDLDRLHALGGNARLRKKSVWRKVPPSNVNYRDVAKAK